MAAVPYKNSNLSKKVQVEEMFDQISHRYDLLNHLLSVNIDKIWRGRAIKMLRPHQPETILDIATGTADFAVAAKKLNPKKITGIDLSEGMLKIGRQKVKKKGLSYMIELQKADSEALPFDSESFDAATVGFGVRNFENLEKGLAEIYRVLQPGGVFIVLEFSLPRNKVFRSLYFFYFLKVLPWLGRFVSKDERAYTYLPESVREFPCGEDFARILEKTGFEKCKWVPQTMGIATIYEAQKPKI
ncbi:demethylmenaquinone methyltransferase [Mariniphaga anaerophila]|uniref:Demethylmenaquinone methyltransferase n=1 Tax=Mariniphaga anaerophila TaxID=1484053 RepID=A0A1M5DAG4_9BACT|nr:bifunctional demethylmenaquinone methyltransferase/2-methoxy-6-polyprenyl-1,4-benzoquinol methylase UbiE [Mariniphaga anaerophila]SHF63880.1 demethylmenaquinone methyltransferase [Mariniphaga anaerophila]